MRFLHLFGAFLILVIAAAGGQASTGLRLPPSAQGPISAVLGKDDSGYWVTRNTEGFREQNPRHALTTDFTKQGIEVRRYSLNWGLETRAYGYGNALRPIKAVAPQVKANRVEYVRDGVTEWYENGPLGLEQGFTLADRPRKTNSQPLTLVLSMHGDFVARRNKRRTGLDLLGKDGKTVLRYSGLTAKDATGQELRAWLEVRGDRLFVRVSDSGARYPVTIDPWIQKAELTSSDGAVDDVFGTSVAISGGTLVVGAPLHTVGSNEEQGAAYVFVQNGTTWSQQAELTASDGATNDRFGQSIAISGSTIVVGAYERTIGSNTFQGAAYVFAQTGGNWVQQAELTSSDGAAYDNFGCSVSVNGGTVLVGALHHGLPGSAYVFIQSSTDWTEQAELTASDGGIGDDFGTSVAVSGSTVVVGSPLHAVGSNFGQGAAYVFVQSGTSWPQQAELTASDGGSDEFFGSSVAASGSTAVASAYRAAYVFSQSSDGWSQQSELPIANFDGGYVAVEGGTIVAGAPVISKSYVFVESGDKWGQQAELAASDGTTQDLFGDSVAISGSTAVIGAPSHEVGSNQGQGAAYVFGQPTVTLSPSSLSFSNRAVDTTSTAKSVTLTNTGTVTLDVSGITTSADFAISANTCGAKLTAGKTCKLGVAFTPKQLGPLTGTLSVTYDAFGSPQTVPLSGMGVAQATVTPTALTFPTTKVSKTSAPKNVVLKNNLPTTLTGISYSATGPFSISTTTCTTTLASGKICTISVTFTPTETGKVSGTVDVSDSANNSPQRVSMSGTGD